MERIYFHSDSCDETKSVDSRDERAKFAYHHGAALARAVLDRLLPALSKDDGDWLYDQIFELHMALYSATLFEVHLTSSMETFDEDDWYSNGWPVLWREEKSADENNFQPLYEDIGEHPQDSVWMISPPELAYEPSEEAAAMVEMTPLGEAPPNAWKVVFDSYLKGLVTIDRDDAGRINKSDDGTPMHPTWVINTGSTDFNGVAQGLDN
jgi:hypothetical protein